VEHDVEYQIIDDIANYEVNDEVEYVSDNDSMFAEEEDSAAVANLRRNHDEQSSFETASEASFVRSPRFERTQVSVETPTTRLVSTAMQACSLRRAPINQWDMLPQLEAELRDVDPSLSYCMLYANSSPDRSPLR